MEVDKIFFGLTVCFFAANFFFASFKNFWKGYEYYRCRDDSCRKVGYAFGEEHSFEADETGEDKAKRNEYDYLSQNGKYKRGLGASERDVYVLKSHLNKEHYGTHKEKRSIFNDDLSHRGACRKQIRVDNGKGERSRPDERRIYESYDGHIDNAFFKSRRVAFAVVVADKRLNAVTESVKRQSDELKRAQHNGKRGRIILVPSRREFEVYIEYDLYGTFRKRHDERRKAERQYGENSLDIRLHVLKSKSENTFLREEECDLSLIHI